MRLYSVALLVAAVLLENLERATSFELTTADNPTVIIRSVDDHQHGVAPKRLLRRYQADDEERAFGGGAISELTTKLKSSASKLTQIFANTEKYEAKMATKLKLGDNVMNTLTSSNLQRLTDKVKHINSKNIINKASVIGTLTARYGDDVLTKALVAAQKKTTDPASVQQIQALRKDQMSRWLNSGNSVYDVSQLLKIRKDKVDIFVNGKLKVLEDYVKLVNRKNFDQMTLTSALTNAFHGEDKLGAVLKTAKMDPRTAKKATQLENSLVNKWTDQGQLPKNVYHWLQLYIDVDYAFTANNLNKFAKYVDNFNKNNPSKKVSTLELYMNNFKDAELANKIVSAMNNQATRSVAEKLQAQQLKGWVKNTKSIDYVLTTLKIEGSEGAAITSRKLDVLEEFIKRRGGEQNLIKTLTTKFGSKQDLALILEKASTSKEPTSLQKKQFTAFVKKDIDPENFMSSVFKTIPTTPTDDQKAIAAKFKVFYDNLKSG